MNNYNWGEKVEEFTPEGATLSFVKFQKDGILFYGFDSRLCVPPEPMVNAIIGLKMLKNENEKLIMINHKNPMGLFPKIDGFFDYTSEQLQEGGIKIIFSYIPNQSQKANLTDNHCEG